MNRLFENKTKDEIRNTFNDLLLSDNASKLIKEYFDEICTIIPELKKMQGFDQNNRYHIYNVLDHTLVVLENTPKDLITRLTALFHDVAKPLCYTVDEKGRGHFYGHDLKGVEVTKKVLKRMGYDDEIIRDVLQLIKYHDYQLILRERPLKKLLKKIDNRLIDKLFAIKRADCLGQNPDFISRLDVVNQAEKLVNEILTNID